MASDDECQTRLLRHLTSMLESQQSLNSRLSEVIDRNSAYDAGFTKLHRQIHSSKDVLIDIRADTSSTRSDVTNLRSDINGLRSEFAQRLNATNSRFEELENASEKSTALIKELRIEAASHYNEILNAVQSGMINAPDLRGLTERVENIEKRLAP